MSLAKNKLAYHNYKFSDELEAGLVLSGPEVKSIKKGSLDLKGAYVSLDKNLEPHLVNMYIAPYKPARSVQQNYNPHQPRKLLLTNKEIRLLIGKSKEKGVSIIPLEIFLKNRLIKVKIGIGIGKKKFDKREDIKKRDFDRRKLRALKN